MIIWKNVWKAKEGWINKFISIVKVRPYLYLQSKVLCTYSLVQSNLAIRNFLNALKLFLNAKSSLFLWSKWQTGHRKWFLNTNFFLIKPFLIAKFDCNNLLYNLGHINEQPYFIKFLCISGSPLAYQSLSGLSLTFYLADTLHIFCSTFFAGQSYTTPAFDVAIPSLDWPTSQDNPHTTPHWGHIQFCVRIMKHNSLKHKSLHGPSQVLNFSARPVWSALKGDCAADSRKDWQTLKWSSYR